MAVHVVAEREARDRRGEDDQALEQDARALDRLRPEHVDRDEQRGRADEDAAHRPVEAALARVVRAAREELRERRRDDERADEPGREGANDGTELLEARLARAREDAPHDLGEDEHRQVEHRDRGAGAGAATEGEADERVEERARDREQPGVGDDVAAERDPRRDLVLEQEVQEDVREAAGVPQADRQHEDGEQTLAADPALAAQNHAEEQEVEHGPEQPARDEDDLLEGQLVVHRGLF